MREPIAKILIFVVLHKTIFSYYIIKTKYTNWKEITNHIAISLQYNSKKKECGMICYSSMTEKEKEKEKEEEKEEKKEQCIIRMKDGRIFCKSKLNLFLLSNDYLSDKELITISPGGLKGFYLLGILSYIKDHYKTDHLIYSGASAGSWNSLFMCYKGNAREFIYDLMHSIVMDSKSIMEMQYFMKYKILSKYKTEDFDLKKLFIGVSKLEGFAITSNIFTEFNTLEDAIHCCMASSHIPILTGGLTNKYNNMYSLDGGLSNYPYLHLKSKLHVYPDMWKKGKQMDIEQEDRKKENIFVKLLKGLLQLPKYFSLKNNNPIVLFDDGYQDAKINSEYLDGIFMRKNTTDNDENASNRSNDYSIDDSSLGIPMDNIVEYEDDHCDVDSIGLEIEQT